MKIAKWIQAGLLCVVLMLVGGCKCMKCCGKSSCEKPAETQAK